MSKRVVFEQTNSDIYCSCNNPNFTKNEIHEQHGGDIRVYVIGEYCTNCGMDKAPSEELENEV